MRKRIFITGAAGFIGYHLAKKLAQRGDLVLGFDNFNAYYNPQLKRDRAALLKNFPLVEGDLTDWELLKQTVQQFQPTHIVNLAAQAGVRYSIEHPRDYLLSNIDGFFNVLEICRAFPHIKLTYASSSSVYGENDKIPFSEEDPLEHLASFYAVTKKSNEMMAAVYHKIYGISVTGLRYFTVYGEWGRPDMAYFSFTEKILNGEPVSIYNEGMMSRDFTYIDDIIEGTIAAIDLGAPCEIFNLGNSQPETLGRFIEMLESHLGRKAIRKYVPMQKGDVQKTYADISKSSQKLGYHPKTSLEEGIPKFVFLVFKVYWFVNRFRYNHVDFIIKIIYKYSYYSNDLLDLHH